LCLKYTHNAIFTQSKTYEISNQKGHLVCRPIDNDNQQQIRRAKVGANSPAGIGKPNNTSRKARRVKPNTSKKARRVKLSKRKTKAVTKGFKLGKS
jgi:hypothetical protein